MRYFIQWQFITVVILFSPNNSQPLQKHMLMIIALICAHIIVNLGRILSDKIISKRLDKKYLLMYNLVNRTLVICVYEEQYYVYRAR